jgi:hypothetical protein
MAATSCIIIIIIISEANRFATKLHCWEQLQSGEK